MNASTYALPGSLTFFQAWDAWELMFDIEIREVYFVNQEVPEYGETPKKIGQIHDIWRSDPVASSYWQ